MRKTEALFNWMMAGSKVRARLVRDGAKPERIEAHDKAMRAAIRAAVYSWGEE